MTSDDHCSAPSRCSRPEGLGINRGFLGALDCADLVQHAMPLLLTPLGKVPATVDAFHNVIQRREDLFGITKRISGTNRLSELKAHLDCSRRYQYTLDPSTRYTSWHGTAMQSFVAGNTLKAAPSHPRMAFHASIRGAYTASL